MGEAEQQGTGAQSPDVENLVRAMGRVFSDVTYYGLSHGVTITSMESCFAALGLVLGACPEVAVTLSEDMLLVNGITMDQKTPLVRFFADHLKRMGVGNFSFLKGMKEDDFVKWVEIMNSKPDDLKAAGGFCEAMAASGIATIRAVKTVYRRVAEDEIVVSKDAILERWTGPGPAPTGEGDVAGARQYLQVGGTSEDQAALESLRNTAKDVARLAALVVEVAKSTWAGMNGEKDPGFESRVVDCVRRVSEGLRAAPGAQTQKGRKALASTLKLLGQEIVDQAGAGDADVGADLAGSVNSAIEAMTDELNLEALAGEYAKKRSAIEASEKRILRFMEGHASEREEVEKIGETLRESGLSTEDWQELRRRSGLDNSPTTLSGVNKSSMPAVGQLAALLDVIGKDLRGYVERSGLMPIEDLQKLLRDVDREVRMLVSGAEQKIQGLIAAAKRDDDRPVEKDAVLEMEVRRLSRRRLKELLSEIVQELCQPLAVVNCSIDMILARNAGALTDQQDQLLMLAAKSGERLRGLVERLMRVSGVPGTMEPDAGIRDMLYVETGTSVNAPAATGAADAR